MARELLERRILRSIDEAEEEARATGGDEAEVEKRLGWIADGMKKGAGMALRYLVGIIAE